MHSGSNLVGIDGNWRLGAFFQSRTPTFRIMSKGKISFTHLKSHWVGHSTEPSQAPL